jgi:hypothetical protein
MAGERRSLSDLPAGGAAIDDAPDPASSAYALVVGALERAELAARERRLAAENEAETILARAGATVAELETALPARKATALAESRARHDVAADAEIQAIEMSLAAELPGVAPAAATIRMAAELLVAAVLGEDPGAG